MVFRSQVRIAPAFASITQISHASLRLNSLELGCVGPSSPPTLHPGPQFGDCAELCAFANEDVDLTFQGVGIISRVPSSKGQGAYLGLGDYDQAFAWLEQAYKEQSNILQFVKTLPVFDPVRNDPRFKDLVRRVGLD